MITKAKELSKKNPDYISPNRRKELEWFCLQYDELQQELHSLSFLQGLSYDKINIQHTNMQDPTFLYAKKRASITKRINLIESVAKKVSPDKHYQAFLYSCTHTGKYETFCDLHGLLLPEREYYSRKRHFYKLLDEERD